MNHPDDIVIADHEAELERAQRALDENEPGLGRDLFPRYHIAARSGWINDPNGLVFHKGRYHVFYQHHPYDSTWGPMHWGHVAGPSLTSLSHEPVALAPSIEADREGCWSGSCVEGPDGALYAFYTGHRFGPDKLPKVHNELQCLAVSDDAIHFEKQGVVVDNPEHLRNFRDPKVFAHDGRWYMVLGRESSRHRGQVGLFVSDDLVDWRDAGTLYEFPDESVTMLECPDLFPLADRWVLVFSAMGLRLPGRGPDELNHVCYVVGTFEPGEPLHVERGPFLVDEGHNFYAPQTLETPDGRRVQLGWMRPSGHDTPEHRDGWCGQMTLARELSLTHDLRLAARPIDEVGDLFGDPRELGPMTLEAGRSLTIDEDLPCAHIRLAFRPAARSRSGLVFARASAGDELRVTWDAIERTIACERTNAADGRIERRVAEVDTDAPVLDVYLDRSSVEVFADGGAHVLTEVFYPGPEGRSVELVAEGEAVAVRSLVVERLARGIWQEA